MTNKNNNKKKNNKQTPKTLIVKFNFMWFWAAIIIAIIGYSLFGGGVASRRGGCP